LDQFLKRLTLFALLLCAPFIAAQSFAQTWPTKPIRLIIPYAAGGPADVVGRELARQLSQHLAQSVVVENQGGGMGIPALIAVTRADPDGHTLLMPAVGNIVLQPLLSKSGGAEQVAKLRPVGLVSTAAHVLVVSSKLPVKNVPELIEFARNNPGKLSFASAGTGGTAHLAMEMFKSLTKTDVLHVPYKGSSAAVSDLVSGQVGAMFSSLPSLQGVADKGYVKVLAATAPSSSPATKNLPLMSERIPGFSYTTWYAIYAPAAMPNILVEQISAALRKVLTDPAMEQKLEPHGVELLAGGPQGVSALVKRDTEKWTAVIRDAKISLD
jgi:tripartite-type tricarboxylate transporter receptor subunit TctC